MPVPRNAPDKEPSLAGRLMDAVSIIMMALGCFFVWLVITFASIVALLNWVGWQPPSHAPTECVCYGSSEYLEQFGYDWDLQQEDWEDGTSD